MYLFVLPCTVTVPVGYWIRQSFLCSIYVSADGSGPEPRGGGEGDGEHAAGLPGPLHPAEVGGGAAQVCID
jgi:hypothetical protein